MMPVDEHPMLWISVKNADKLLRYAKTRWKMYASTREAWRLYLSTVVDAAVLVDADVGPAFIENGPMWLHESNFGMNGYLTEEVAHKWADNALALLQKYSKQPRKLT